jgi:hypothetical protein
LALHCALQDHGDGQADHFHWRKGFPYQFSANVPMLFRWPASFGPTKTPRGTVITDLVTELRDVFPTMLDAAGGLHLIPSGHRIDGTSLICLLSDPTGADCNHTTPGEHGNVTALSTGWRPWLDLEHSTCYNNTNHWSALTDGRMKYIFNACEGCSFPAIEQLFNLTADPGERVGLHTNPDYAVELAKWRGRMVAQFQAEGRGPNWVSSNGTLLTRPAETYGPNYPQHGPNPPGKFQCTQTTLVAGDGIDLRPNQETSPTRICQDVHATALGQMAMTVAPTLCVQPSAAAGPGVGLSLANCSTTAVNPLQQWELPSIDKSATTVVHKSSGLCLTGSAGGTARLATCTTVQSLEPGADEQHWILGASGRLCTPSGCISVVTKPSMRLTFL